MTRRERMEARLEKRTAWAASRTRKAETASDAAHRAVEGIPLGQPILVGHHSERRHRADLARCDGAMRQAVEHRDMATHHAGKAAGLERQLDRSIFSDDADAAERLREKIAGEEAQLAQWKAINATYKTAKGAAGWGATLGLTPEREQRLAARVGTLSWIKAPIETYQFANARNRIRQARERLTAIERQATAQAAAVEAGGVTITETPVGTVGDWWTVVTFAEKPAREILEALRAAGFHWAGGSWQGYAHALPESVRALVAS